MSDLSQVVVIDSGGANLASLQYALERLGAGTIVGDVLTATTSNGSISG